MRGRTKKRTSVFFTQKGQITRFVVPHPTVVDNRTTSGPRFRQESAYVDEGPADPGWIGGVAVAGARALMTNSHSVILSADTRVGPTVSKSVGSNHEEAFLPVVAALNASD